KASQNQQNTNLQKRCCTNLFRNGEIVTVLILHIAQSTPVDYDQLRLNCGAIDVVIKKGGHFCCRSLIHYVDIYENLLIN
ncbi:MAG TPA: hypothetical protein PKN13_10730, partial [Accumulibacter sp.]|nr:hypothetical protein [Accumulibacter sp.]HMX21867.1 hypothetical protein [Accumulibacter sp.]HMY07622.1 hypothetical protein [Accumulibacter sp.]HNE13705.1 hypothetical protein [Accumulibacter sp.]HNG38775.1 hypothetical protein [Accumulibacter sp.]